MKRPPLKSGDVYPADVLRDEYGMNAANRPVFTVEPAEVPEPLRFLIPSVERWAIPCDVTRGDYFAQQPEEDIAAFWHDVRPYVDEVHRWLDSQPANVGDWPRAAIHFMYFLKAHSEAWQPTPEEQQQMRERQAHWAHQQSLEKAIASGTQAFAAKDYPAVVAALEPFAAELDRIVAAKLVYARKRMIG
jgi:hypothetical protein